MIQFYDYIVEKYCLNEKDIFMFRKGQDQDYTGHPSEVLVFSEKEPDEYLVKGKTHGQMSHAIKHLIEYEPQFVAAVAEKAKTAIRKFLERRPDYFCKMWDEVRGFSEYSGLEALKHCSTLALLNTLDIINDKNQTKSPFSKVDGELKKYGVEIEHRYNELIKKKMDAAYDLDKQRGGDYKKSIADNSVITFRAVGGNGKSYNVWLDFKDATLMIGDMDARGARGQIMTMYRLDNAGTNKASIIKQFYTKRLTPKNPDIDSALSGAK